MTILDETCTMMIIDDPHPKDELESIINGVATGVYWQYRKWVELDDLKQEGWLAYFSNRRVMDALRDNHAGLVYIRRRINSAVSTYAVREMCHRTGVEWEDQYTYSKGEVRALVTLVLAGGPAGFEAESMIAGYVDVKEALLAGAKEDQSILWDAYGPAREATHLSSTDRSKARRAIVRIQRKLNGEDPDSEP